MRSRIVHKDRPGGRPWRSRSAPQLTSVSSPRQCLHLASGSDIRRGRGCDAIYRGTGGVRVDFNRSCLAAVRRASHPVLGESAGEPRLYTGKSKTVRRRFFPRFDADRIWDRQQGDLLDEDASRYRRYPIRSSSRRHEYMRTSQGTVDPLNGTLAAYIADPSVLCPPARIFTGIRAISSMPADSRHIRSRDFSRAAGLYRRFT